MLDVLWGVPSYERLVTAWNLDGQEATEAITWLIGLLVDAIRHDRRPGADPGPGQLPGHSSIPG